MEVIETKLKKLVASDGKVIVLKQKEYDENGNEIPRYKSKIVYLAINDSEDNYEEIDEEISEEE